MNEAFDFNQQLILEDDVVLLRPLQLSDVDYLLDISENEPETWEYSLVRANGKENLINYIQLAIDGRDKKTEFPFIVFDKRTGRYAGSTRYYDINFPFKTLQLGYTWYGKDFRGTGLNQHCKFLLLQQAFEVMNMERVEFRADNKNAISIAAMKSIGCTVEGILRNNMPTYSGNRRDTIVLSVLRNDWFETTRTNLQNRF
ncbi:MAG TPA: GNAT family protein [Flavobacterium sp.]|jgi:RimJ/RimL family protein N-acetyltransferase|nr:GNAT family protein [Flavobacterium sp.]